MFENTFPQYIRLLKLVTRTVFEFTKTAGKLTISLGFCTQRFLNLKEDPFVYTGAWSATLFGDHDNWPEKITKLDR